MHQNSPHTFRNRILANLSSTELEALLPHLKSVDLPQATVLRAPESSDTWSYFLESGLASSTAMSEEGDSVEVAMVGREGMVGISSMLGHRGMPHHTLMQAGGAGYQIDTAILRNQFLQGGKLMTLVHNLIYAQLAQSAQSALCNRLHTLEARLARWLLTASDLMETNVLRFTQEFLAQMVGSERSSATMAAGILKRAGMIEYRRGSVEIVNRHMLEDASCECYHMLRKEFVRIYAADPDPAS